MSRGRAEDRETRAVALEAEPVERGHSEGWKNEEPS